MEDLTVKVIAIDKVFYDGPVKELVITTTDGLMGFLKGHADCALVIEIGEMRIQKTDGTWITAITGLGHMLLVGNHATLIVDTVETQEEIDVRRAEEAKRRAEEQLLQKHQIWEYHMAQANLARAKARLKIKGRI